MKKIRKNPYALNPLAASVAFMTIMVLISIGVNLLTGTSAASISQEELKISRIDFSSGQSIAILVENSGTATLTLKGVWIDDNQLPFTADPQETIAPNDRAIISMDYFYSNGTGYQIRILTARGISQTVFATAP